MYPCLVTAQRTMAGHKWLETWETVLLKCKADGAEHVCVFIIAVVL